MAMTSLLGYMSSFTMSMGPVAWLVLSELLPTLIRVKDTPVCSDCQCSLEVLGFL